MKYGTQSLASSDVIGFTYQMPEVYKRDLAMGRYFTRMDELRSAPVCDVGYDIYDKLKERYGKLVCKTRIGETVGLATSPMHGLDIFAYAPNSPGATDYKLLATELMESGFF